jgi:hypothetical protein
MRNGSEGSEDSPPNRSDGLRVLFTGWERSLIYMVPKAENLGDVDEVSGFP